MTNKLFLLLLLGLIACQTADEKVVGIGEGIRHDDFVYSVRRVNVTDGGSRLNRTNPDNRLWLVVFQVANQAEQAGYIWSDSTAFVSDSAGNRYEALSRMPTGPKTTPAGQTDSTTLLFSLPQTLKQPYLLVRGETRPGDLLDGRHVGKTKIRLF
ncbi:MAG: hypothetical protein H7Z72_23470 [Bacteroidetes bacterium]|nr:hypothetical protein [Fibrella sp.]